MHMDAGHQVVFKLFGTRMHNGKRISASGERSPSRVSQAIGRSVEVVTASALILHTNLPTTVSTVT